MGLKIAIVTSTRAEYGLLYPLLKELIQDPYFSVNLIATGTHLLKKFGNTVELIVKDKIPIAHQIPIMRETEENVNNIIARGINKFSELYEKEKYDAVIVIGDRYELYSFCIPAIMENIPIVHIHGGEKTEGAVDEKVRHSVTKMATIHFPCLPEYAKRIIQMGENPEYVYQVGALGIDNIMHMPILEKQELEADLGVDLSDDFALMTFHPVTLDGIEKITEQGNILMEALVSSDIRYIVTMPNNDFGSQVLIEIIERYVEQFPEKFIYRKSLGTKKYLSLLRYVKFVIGNSSSGLIEVPSFGIPTINIGDRQRGRFSPETVIHCNCEKNDIENAIKKGMLKSFRMRAANYKSPYGCGDTAKKIARILKEIDFKTEELTKKEFFDLVF